MLVRCAIVERGVCVFIVVLHFVCGPTFSIIIILLIGQSWSVVWENIDLGQWYTPHCVRFVLANLVFPYRPPIQTSCLVITD